MIKRYLLFLALLSSLSASTLHLSTSSNPSRINPILATDSASSEIAGHIFNALLKYDKEAKNIIGDLAKNYYFEDNKTLIFNLRQDVKWHDGENFSAKDVKFTYDLINAPNVVTSYTSIFRMVESVEIVSRYKLRVTYKKPYFKALETWMMGILPEHILRNDKNIMSSPFNTHPVGTGPFKLGKLEFSKNIELLAFDAYFEGRPKIDKISYHVVADPMTRFLMLKTSAIDMGSLQAMQYERQLDEGFEDKFQIIEDVDMSYTYLGFNLKREKFKDDRVREAISLGINRQELLDILFFKHAQVCKGPFHPKTNAFNPDVKTPTQNIERAKRLLNEAGYDEENPFSFEIATSNSNSIRPNAAVILQHQLKQIGVEVKLRIMEWQAFLNMVVFPRNFDTVLLGWSLGITPDPYSTWHSSSDKSGGFNFIGYGNIEVDRLIEKMQLQVDKNKIAQIQRDIFKKIVDDNAYLFLYIPNSITVVNKQIHPIEPSVIGIMHNYIKWEK